MSEPFGLRIAEQSDVDLGPAPVGEYDAEQQLWVGDASAEAVWGCTKFTVQVGPIKMTYGRLLWDMGPAGCSY